MRVIRAVSFASGHGVSYTVEFRIEPCRKHGSLEEQKVRSTDWLVNRRIESDTLLIRGAVFLAYRSDGQVRILSALCIAAD